MCRWARTFVLFFQLRSECKGLRILMPYALPKCKVCKRKGVLALKTFLSLSLFGVCRPFDVNFCLCTWFVHVGRCIYGRSKSTQTTLNLFRPRLVDWPISYARNNFESCINKRAIKYTSIILKAQVDMNVCVIQSHQLSPGFQMIFNL